MPKLRQREKPFAAVARLIRGYATPPTIAEKISSSPQTVRRRLDNPETLTIGELRKIAMALQIPKEEMLGAIKW